MQLIPEDDLKDYLKHYFRNNILANSDVEIRSPCQLLLCSIFTQGAHRDSIINIHVLVVLAFWSGCPQYCGWSNQTQSPRRSWHLLWPKRWDFSNFDIYNKPQVQNEAENTALIYRSAFKDRGPHGIVDYKEPGASWYIPKWALVYVSSWPEHRARPMGATESGPDNGH